MLENVGSAIAHLIDARQRAEVVLPGRTACSRRKYVLSPPASAARWGEPLLGRAPPAGAPVDLAGLHRDVITGAGGAPATVGDDRQGVHAAVAQRRPDRVPAGPQQPGLLGRGQRADMAGGGEPAGAPD